MMFPSHRRSLRLPTHDYTWTRGYFVTIRVRGHDPLFEIPALRAILTDTWEALPQRFPGIALDEFVIMPDHVHFIVWLDGLVEQAPTLGRVVGAYKSLTAVAGFIICKTSAGKGMVISGCATTSSGSFAIKRNWKEFVAIFANIPRSWKPGNTNPLPFHQERITLPG